MLFSFELRWKIEARTALEIMVVLDIVVPPGTRPSRGLLSMDVATQLQDVPNKDHLISL